MTLKKGFNCAQPDNNQQPFVVYSKMHWYSYNFLISKSLSKQNTIIVKPLNQIIMIWTTKVIKHRDENRISVQFEKEVRLIQRIKEFDGARSSAQKKRMISL